jgi:deoxyribose-phosphate aldolase
MKPKEDLLSKAHAVLLDPFLAPQAARSRVESWIELGVRSVWAHTGLLAELEPEGYPDVAFTGVASYPSGCATLSTKRMELLESARLGGKSAAVVLTPSLVATADASGLSREMSGLLSTAREFPVYFVIEAEPLDETGMTVLSRLLREHRPAGLVTGTGVLRPGAPPAVVKELRARITRKVPILAGGDVQDEADARAYLHAGAEGFLTSSPAGFKGAQA